MLLVGSKPTGEIFLPRRIVREWPFWAPKLAHFLTRSLPDFLRVSSRILQVFLRRSLVFISQLIKKFPAHENNSGGCTVPLILFDCVGCLGWEGRVSTGTSRSQGLSLRGFREELQQRSLHSLSETQDFWKMIISSQFVGNRYNCDVQTNTEGKLNDKGSFIR